MKTLFKVEHVFNNTVRVVKLVAKSPEEAILKAQQKYGDLQISKISTIDIDEKIKETEFQLEQLLDKVHRKTENIIKFKVSLIEYQTLSSRLKKEPNYRCFRVSYLEYRNKKSSKYIAVDSKHAVDLFKRENKDLNTNAAEFNVEELFIPYQMKQIKEYIDKININIDKHTNTAALLKRKLFELKSFEKQIQDKKYT